ncbi:GtrA family protein [Pimelobacter simplex]|uniref:GtrA family protein n=1 Tax=Nocardioides simplex TaxID=2045 RepID=UPI00366ACF74
MAASPDDARRPVAGAFARFLVTGGISYLVDVGTLVALHSGLDWPLGLATTGAFAVAFVVTFTLNRIWVFQAGQEAAAGQVVRYLVLVGVNYVATLVIVLGLAHVGVPVVVAKTVAVVAIALSNFFLYRAFVFRTTGPAVDTVPDTQPVEEGK